MFQTHQSHWNRYHPQFLCCVDIINVPKFLRPSAPKLYSEHANTIQSNPITTLLISSAAIIFQCNRRQWIQNTSQNREYNLNYFVAGLLIITVPSIWSMPTILNQVPLQMPWVTLDPFLFCVHHLDTYPQGDGKLEYPAPLSGRNVGSDFSGKDGWSMYHGSTVGFPSHPHRGFETITIGRQGYIDHSDSLGAKARFGKGDVQWMTAGKGVVHSEMFPLINTAEQNPTELFQIWLNLPAQDKMVDPYFTMFWEDTIQIVDIVDDVGAHSAATSRRRHFQWARSAKTAPNSWASRVESDVRFGAFNLKPTPISLIPAAKDGTNRVLYFFNGVDLAINGQRCTVGHAIQVQPTETLLLEIGDAPVEILTASR